MVATDALKKLKSKEFTVSSSILLLTPTAVYTKECALQSHTRTQPLHSVPFQSNLFPDMQIITGVQSNPGIITVNARKSERGRAFPEASGLNDHTAFTGCWAEKGKLDESGFPVKIGGLVGFLH